MRLYIYCLTEGIDTLPETVQGLGRAEIRLFKTGDFSILVSDFSGDVVPVNPDNALTHATVVRSVLEQTTPLPFRFGTLVTEEQMRNYVMTRRDALLAKLAEVRGCVEMNVKIISDRDRTEVQRRDDEVKDKPGTAFLAEKRREILGSESRAAEAKRVASWLQERVGEVARKTQINQNVTDRLLLAAAHLVDRGLVEQYRLRLKEARDERPELKFLVSGPWPPYSFANIDLEFSTQFGVS
jgi:hypothetical protein